MPTALITGITGQDGSYLAELLLAKGYRVVGMARRSSTVTNERIEHLLDRIHVVQGDLHDQGSLLALLEEYEPDEVYNLAAQSFVPTSWNQPALTGDITALGVTRMLEAIRFVDAKIRFYQASSSEMFGRVLEVPQRETTPFYPRSPYGMFNRNAYLWPLIVLTEQNVRTLPIILSWFSNQHTQQLHLTMAASVLVILPVLFVFILTQRWIVKGNTLTGMK